MSSTSHSGRPMNREGCHGTTLHKSRTGVGFMNSSHNMGNHENTDSF